MNGDVPTAGTDATVRQGSASVPGRPDLGPCASVSYDGTAPLADVLAALGVPERRPVLVLAGWAGTDLPEETQDALDLLLRAVVVPVCREQGAVVVSGGTDAGVMAALGKAASETPDGLVLVGVAPAAKLLGFGADAEDEQAARPEPAHRLVLTTGDSWGDEGPVLVRVAEKIAEGSSVVVLAAGGRAGTAREVALAARRGWPVLFLTGHGGTSNDLAAALRLPIYPTSRAEADRPGRGVKSEDLASALVGRPDREAEDVLNAARAGLHAAVDLEARDAARRLLRWGLSEEHILKEAWARFAGADVAAVRRKKPTTLMAGSVVGLAALTVLCALAAGRLGSRSGSQTTAANLLKGFVIGLPLVAGLLLALMERRARSGTWVELRSAAEALLREIYRERSRPADPSAPTHSRAVLAAALYEVDRRTNGRLLLAAPNGHGRGRTWPPPHLWGRVPASDCLLGRLTARVYDSARVVDQLEHYERAARDFDRKATRLAAGIFVTASIAAFLLAVSWRSPGFTVYAAVPASIAAALVSWREYRQRDARVDAMLTTCVAVREARGRWLSRAASDRNTPEALTTLVEEVEDALTTEGTDWERGLRLAHQNFTDRHRR